MNNNANKRIIIVEEDEDARYFLKNYLQKINCEAFVFGSGAESTNFIFQMDQRPDLAIFDYVLPDMTGTQAAEALNRWQDPPVPVIFLSEQGHLPRRLWASPLAIVLKKPVELFDLRIVIEGLLQNGHSPMSQNA